MSLDIPIGDTHNFGGYVRIIDELWIQKPRPLIWEHIFLDKRSLLRQLLEQLGCFHYLPDLYIDPEFGFWHNGRAEILRLDEKNDLDIVNQDEIGESIGSLLALSTQRLREFMNAS